MGKKYKVKKDYGSGQRSSYYGFRKDFPEGEIGRASCRERV